MDRTLDAEMEAARSAARRRLSVRDRLLDAGDRSAVLVLATINGSVYRGVVEAVGVDHVELIHAGGCILVAIQHITVIEERQ